jgi:hypothetical protein
MSARPGRGGDVTGGDGDRRTGDVRPMALLLPGHYRSGGAPLRARQGDPGATLVMRTVRQSNLAVLVRFALLFVLAAMLSACGSGRPRNAAILVTQGSSGETTSAACGETTNLQIADVTARRQARVVSARLQDADPGLHATDVLGAPETIPALLSGANTNRRGSGGTRELHVGVTSIDAAQLPDDLAVHLPGGVPISRNARRPTALFVTVTASCARHPPPSSDLGIRAVTVTVRSGRRTLQQRIVTDDQVCVGPVAPKACP